MRFLALTAILASGLSATALAQTETVVDDTCLGWTDYLCNMVYPVESKTFYTCGNEIISWCELKRREYKCSDSGSTVTTGCAPFTGTITTSTEPDTRTVTDTTTTTFGEPTDKCMLWSQPYCEERYPVESKTSLNCNGEIIPWCLYNGWLCEGASTRANCVTLTATDTSVSDTATSDTVTSGNQTPSSASSASSSSTTSSATTSSLTTTSSAATAITTTPALPSPISEIAATATGTTVSIKGGNGGLVVNGGDSVKVASAAVAVVAVAVAALL
ncbi:hypothetical protein HDU96_005939 [Phlyctochytrium bullatum]|nr:hypothetical protein HDU96_005939 [Phlyctochytrium bullatum]